MPSLWNYVQEYPGRLRDQFTQGMQQFARTRNPAAALGALNPTTPFIQDAALQAGGLIAPQANQLNQAVSQASENLGLGPLSIPEVTDEQLAPFLMLGMGSPSKMGFFSPSGKALTTAPGKGTSQQYLAHLKKEPGATKEAKQTGLIQRLEEAPGTLTKEEVVSMWNPIELTETVKGDLSSAREVNLDSPYAIPEVLNIANMATNTPGDLEMTLVNNPDAYYALEANFPELLENEDWGEIVVNSVFGGDSKPSDLVKYGNEANLNLPGGEEPKEILVQLPVRPMSIEDYESQLSAQIPALLPREDVLERYQNYLQDFEAGIGPVGPGANYKSGHWDEPNVLAHIRTNKRDVGGVSALHAEEFQSDWHQEGQKKGYGTSMPHDERHRLEMQKQRIEHLLVDTTNEEYHDRLSSELKKIEETLRNDSLNRGKVPDAPYKKDWHELAFKRFLMEGINDPSVDRITWTSGAVQADRYDLSKQVDAIQAHRNPDGTYYIRFDSSGGELEDVATTVPSEKLPEIVGKELADKIIAEVKTEDRKKFSGVDLQVGGEFHKQLYDKKIPQFAKKFLKKYGVEPQRTSTSNLFRDEEFEIIPDNESADRTDDQHDLYHKGEWVGSFPNYKAAEDHLNKNLRNLWYIDITPEMRQDLQQKGVPLAMNDRKPLLAYA